MSAKNDRKTVVESASYRVGPMGPDLRHVLPSAIQTVDPFVFFDHYGPLNKEADWEGVPFHPHAGISTITYVISGTNRHQDSLGSDAVMQKGDISLMRAGKGIVHAEGLPSDRTEVEISHGLQFWTSLPAAKKFIDPNFTNYSSESLPKIGIGNATVKILCGELNGHQSPVQVESPAFIYELKVQAGETVDLPIKEDDSCALYIIDGQLNVGEQTLTEHKISLFSAQGNHIHIEAQTACHAIIFGGTPLNEPIFARGSFVMNSREQLIQVERDYHSGKMNKI